MGSGLKVVVAKQRAIGTLSQDSKDVKPFDVDRPTKTKQY